MQKFFIRLAFLIGITISITACSPPFGQDIDTLFDKAFVGDFLKSSTMLTANTWTDGNIPTDGQQWFKFTATASTQFIHVSFGSLKDLAVRVYDSSGDWVGGKLYGKSNRYNKYNESLSITVTIGQEYYIRVDPVEYGTSSYKHGDPPGWLDIGWRYSGSGTYRISFSATPWPSDAIITPLTVNIWTDGDIPTLPTVQWFKFTATASTQFIHVSFGTLDSLRVQIYDSSGADIRDENNYSFSKNYNTSLSVTTTLGQEYYIMVCPNQSYYNGYPSYYSGTYKIGFNATINPPGTTITQLYFNTFADGNLPTSSDE